jgi:NhaP-type Na+/H+ or K+/H+ antiporter
VPHDCLPYVGSVVSTDLAMILFLVGMSLGVLAGALVGWLVWYTR